MGKRIRRSRERRKIGVAMNDDGDVMMQNSSKLKEINKALMGNTNRVEHQWVKECMFIHTQFSFITYGIIIIIIITIHTHFLLHAAPQIRFFVLALSL